MGRLIDADALIEDLEYDVELDARALDDTDLLLGRNRELVQFDKDCKQNAIVMLKKEPTVDAEPVRHGKYIGTEFDGYADGCPVYYEWKCSECGCVFEEEEPTYNYCPYCGAKMDGAERKEE